MTEQLIDEQQNLEINTLKICMQNIEKRFDKLEGKFDGFIKEIKDSYVSKIEFKPVQKIVYGLVGTILTTVLLAGLYLIINK
jgi:thiosulfate reductase cytochrome b subunit